MILSSPNPIYDAGSSQVRQWENKDLFVNVYFGTCGAMMNIQHEVRLSTVLERLSYY